VAEDRTLTADLAVELVTAYLGAWAERRSSARRRLLQHCWAEDASFSSWTTNVQGFDAMDAHIAACLRQLPRRSRRVRTYDIHVSGDKLGFTWVLFDQDDAVILEGSEFVQVGADGRFVRVTSFAGRPEVQTTSPFS
jgi:hypothetical protein